MPVFTALVWLVPASATAQPLESLPPWQRGNWIVDHAEVIEEYARVQLMELCTAISGFQRAEMVILTVQRTGGAPRQYALDYFNRERIGDTRNNNGILIMLAMQDRAVEIILGDGLKSTANNRAANRVIDDLIVPRMRRNDVAGALFGGAFGMARDVLGYTELARDIPKSRIQLGEESQRQRGRGGEPGAGPSVGMYLLLLGAGAVGLLGIVIVIGRYRVRYGARNCDKCNHAMVMLNEQQDDSFLDPPEIIEEELGSVDYDVWACDNCNNVVKYRYGAFFTRYSRCPRCRYRTRSKVSRVVRTATTSRGGVVRVDERCANCSHVKTWTYSTPRLPKASSGGGWSGGGWSGGGWSGGGGGGFSSGRSGGFSSGGGGSGRW